MSESAQIVWSPLVGMLSDAVVTSSPRPRVIAISGAQGSGKTTLAALLSAALAERGVRATTCSLDDFYYPRAARIELSRTVHRLLLTRGVPGTHDVELCLRVLDALRVAPTAIPRFDKGLDDRVDAAQWPVVGPVDTVILEGWCLGARPQSDAVLATPLNDLERIDDADGRWRRYVDAQLAHRYRALFDRFDRWIYLRVPDFAAVLRWRGEQELAISPERRMDAARLSRFVAHYERVTRAMFVDTPAEADVTVLLDDRHRIANVVTRPGETWVRAP
jgi:D-glycerate 3-kinase